MKRYICENCGSKIDTIEQYSFPCPICKGKLVAEAEQLEREQIEKNIELDNYFIYNPEEYITPEEDMQETMEDNIIVSIQEHIKQRGDTSCWNMIERLAMPEQRAIYRKYFIMAGGTIPEGEPI